MKAEAIAVTTEEGGEWHEFKPYRETHRLNDIRSVHAIKFADGSIWDTINGWRPDAVNELLPTEPEAGVVE